MPLIACPDCSNQVSDRAPTCPSCGTPIANIAETAAIGTSLTTVQETSKRLKGHQLIAIALLVIGVAVMVIGRSPTSTGGRTIGTLMILIGFVWYIVTRFRIWWHHK